MQQLLVKNALEIRYKHWPIELENVRWICLNIDLVNYVDFQVNTLHKRKSRDKVCLVFKLINIQLVLTFTML